jgi:pilus assembly protein FimV
MEEVSTDEIHALETETAEDLNFPMPPAPAAQAEAKPKPSLEIARGPRAPSIDQVLDECDFFAVQGLIQEALMLLEDLLSQYPGNQLIVEKISELKSRQLRDEMMSQKPSIAAVQWPQAEDGSMSQATDEAIEELGALEKIISPAEFEEPIEEALISTPSEIDAADAQTHHDLGIAYMEMGLWDQAIAEFRIGAQNPQMEATSYNLIGNCLSAANSIDEAIKEYKLGLFAKNKTLEQEMSLYYDIAQAYIKLDDYKEALYYLQNINKKKPDYKDVEEKIGEITKSFGKAIVEKEERAEKKKAAAPSPREAAKEVDEAFDDLFGDFKKK